MSITKTDLIHKIEILETIYEYKKSLAYFIRYNVEDGICANTHLLVNHALTNKELLNAEKTLESDCFGMKGDGWEVVRIANK